MFFSTQNLYVIKVELHKTFPFLYHALFNVDIDVLLQVQILRRNKKHAQVDVCIPPGNIQLAIKRITIFHALSTHLVTLFYKIALKYNSVMSGVKTVALLGSTGKVGGWVLEMALERKHQVKALVRKPEKLDAYKDKIEIVQGGIKDEEKMLELVTGADVVISTLGSPSNSVLIMKTAAETLVKVLSEMDNPPR